MPFRKMFAAFSILLAGALLLGGCQSKAERKEPPVKLTVAVWPYLDSGLVAIADEKGYFRDAGVEVDIKLYPAGLLALEAVSRGEALLATVSDIAFAARMAEDKSIRVIASIGYSTGSEIVARKDKGIATPSGLRGKRIGFTLNTTSDYFLYAFLLNENIPPAEITAVPIPADRQAQALIDGEVDAVSAFNVSAFEARKRLGENAIAWDCQNNLSYQWLLAANASIAESSEPAKRLLRALLMAEKFVLANEAEAKNIIIRRFNLDPELIRHSWSKVRLSVSLNQSVITSLRDFIRWKMKESKDGPQPDVIDFVYPDVLDDVAPRLVNIYR